MVIFPVRYVRLPKGKRIHDPCFQPVYKIIYIYIIIYTNQYNIYIYINIYNLNPKKDQKGTSTKPKNFRISRKRGYPKKERRKPGAYDEQFGTTSPVLSTGGIIELVHRLPIAFWKTTSRRVSINHHPEVSRNHHHFHRYSNSEIRWIIHRTKWRFPKKRVPPN